MAISLYYVDPAIAADSGTGTIGDPYGDLQYALNTLTRNATDGDQINIKAGTAEVLAAALSLTTYGTPTAAAPLILRGYTSAANDGGVGEINCNGATMWASTGYDMIAMIDLEMHTFGNNNGVQLDDYCVMYRCEVHKGASSPTSKYLVRLDQYSIVMGCYVHDSGAYGIGISIGGMGCIVMGNHVVDCTSGISTNNATGSTIINNVIRCSETGARGIHIAGAGPINVIGNSVYNSAAGTTEGINVGQSGGNFVGVCLNNVVQGWSGTGGLGIGSDTAGIYAYLVGWNAFFNNTANYSITGQTIINETAYDDALASAPWVNPGSGDFDVNGTIAGVTEDAWPLAFLGNASTAPKADKGAVQAGAGSGGAVSISPVRGVL